MTTEEADRLLTACRLLGSHEEEQRLLRSEIADMQLFRSGTSQTYEVTFADGERAAFKPVEGLEATAGGWGHTATGVVLNEIAAWLVARGLGYESLVGGVVLAVPPLADVGLGSMQAWLDGDPSGAGWEGAAQLREAALFDAVIAQQDRNGSNFHYEPATDAIGLFDLSFSFPLPGHNFGASALLAEVHDHGDPTLDEPLLDALDRLAASPEYGAAAQIVQSERWTRVVERITMMRERGELLRGGEF
jgi:hypothetical protein